MANPIIYPSSVAGNPCLLVQATIDQVFGINPAEQFQRYGALNALISDANRLGKGFNLIENTVKPSATNKNVTVQYLTKDCDDSDLSSLNKCDLSGGATPQLKFANYTVDEVVAHKWTINDSDFRNMCVNPTEHFGQILRMNFDQFLRKLDSKVIEALVPLMGSYPLGTEAGNNSNTNAYTLPLISASGTFNPTAIALLQEQYGAMGVSEDAIIVGRGYLSLAERILPFTGVNANGVNTAYRGGFANVHIDDLVDTVSPSTSARLLTWAPGAIQLLNWNEFTSDYAQWQTIERGGSFPAEMRSYKYQRTTIEIVPGLSVDFLYEYDDCNDLHHWALRSNFSVVGMPSDAFGSCQDFNYALNFLQGCGDLTCGNLESISGSQAS